MKERQLIEVSIHQGEETSECIEWCQDNATFLHNEEDEFMFWIPPFDSEMDVILRTIYGTDIPETIQNKLIEAINFRAGQEDGGYLLIAFI